MGVAEQNKTVFDYLGQEAGQAMKLEVGMSRDAQPGFVNALLEFAGVEGAQVSGCLIEPSTQDADTMFIDLEGLSDGEANSLVASLNSMLPPEVPMITVVPNNSDSSYEHTLKSSIAGMVLITEQLGTHLDQRSPDEIKQIMHLDVAQEEQPTQKQDMSVALNTSAPNISTP